ncbi:MAG: alpha/beta fold hydrolase [Proteobacteria bacterium]|nr:alpha/beta fold hydrolase [Pseudomonadota bacterium]
MTAAARGTLADARYRAPRWLPGGNLQTIWPALLSRRPPPVALRRERWTTPDGDFVDVDLNLAAAGAPALVLFHGLEGSSASPYAQAFAALAAARGWSVALPHFRGCSGELNRAPRAYHSGDHEEIGWLLARLRERFALPLLAAGVSLGGNALLRWAGEAGAGAPALVRAVAAISAPLDLAAAGAAIDRGFNRLAYARLFLSTMKPKALAKWQQHPGLFDRERVRAARTIFAFDDAFTAPLHGFAGAADYWARASAKPHLARIRVPALALNARNDPFVPAASLPTAGEAGPRLTLWQPAHGGHCGFPAGGFPGHVMAMPMAVCDWFARQP